MRLCYLLLSPTYGMHQYTADLANRMAATGHDIFLITTALLPQGRYAPIVDIRTPIATSNTGFSREGLSFGQQNSIVEEVAAIAPDVLHFTGPHLWNINLVRRLRRLGYPVIHTIHDLVPHSGMRMGSLLGLWNRFIVREADHILVHGQIYKQKLLQQGVPAEKVTYTPLMHLFIGYEQERKLEQALGSSDQVSYEPFALFFGRLEKYKGIELLLATFAQIEPQDRRGFKLVLAGQGDISSFWKGDLADDVVLHNHFISDKAAVDLFQRCSLVLLPYTDATQSALVAAAYYFKKSVIVSRSGALPEYVVEGETGYTVKAGHPSSLTRKLAGAFSSQEKLQMMGQSGRAWYDSNRALEFTALQSLYNSYSGR